MWFELNLEEWKQWQYSVPHKFLQKLAASPLAVHYWGVGRLISSVGSSKCYIIPQLNCIQWRRDKFNLWQQSQKTRSETPTVRQLKSKFMHHRKSRHEPDIAGKIRSESKWNKQWKRWLVDVTEMEAGWSRFRQACLHNLNFCFLMSSSPGVDS